MYASQGWSSVPMFSCFILKESLYIFPVRSSVVSFTILSPSKSLNYMCRNLSRSSSSSGSQSTLTKLLKSQWSSPQLRTSSVFRCCLC
uniref:Uncharacterized protein n=1 Tax=Picea glauca TaxID=3330 RepID=A0A101LV47_PICGL|nr:hypothetical protein ABT39_MTgene2027 [Picea glauca]